MLMRVNVAGMIHEDSVESFFLILKEMYGSATVPIQVDQRQAESIAIFLDSTFTGIPDPYDFLNSIMDSFELRISKVIIKNRRPYIKNAEVFLTDGERELRVDTHAGDSIASALLVDAPIFIDADALGIPDTNEMKKWLMNIRPRDFGE